MLFARQTPNWKVEQNDLSVIITQRILKVSPDWEKEYKYDLIKLCLSELLKSKCTNEETLAFPRFQKDQFFPSCLRIYPAPSQTCIWDVETPFRLYIKHRLSFSQKIEQLEGQSHPRTKYSTQVSIFIWAIGQSAQPWKKCSCPGMRQGIPSKRIIGEMNYGGEIVFRASGWRKNEICHEKRGHPQKPSGFHLF